MSTVSTEPATQDVVIGRERLEGVLARPGKARGLVIFAHGSGSSRLSPRNVQVARQMQTQRLATLLFDLLTEHEAYDRRNVFDFAMLGGRMVEAVRFARSDPELSRLPIGLFGASTGAAAALVAAAKLLLDIVARSMISSASRHRSPSSPSASTTGIFTSSATTTLSVPLLAPT